MTLAFDDILAAQARLQGHIERTPCRRSRTLSEITGAEVWVKFENLQFTAAYKERGALNKLLQLGENVRARGVIAASAGNHSQGLAYHAARLGIPFVAFEIDPQVAEHAQRRVQGTPREESPQQQMDFDEIQGEDNNGDN